jgi:hypothetical protein
MRRFSLAAMATIAAALGVALSISATASAAITQGQFNLHFTSAKVILGGLTTLDVPGSDPALAGKTIDVKANVASDGTITAYRDALSFPTVPIDVSGISANVGIVQTGKTTGTIDPNSYAMSLPLALGVRLDASSLGLPPCTIPVPFTFDTNSHAVSGSDSVNGVAYDPATKAITLAAVAEVPMTITPSDSCSADAATLIGGLLSSLGGGGGAMKIGIALSGTLDMPGGDFYADPDPVTTPPTTTVPTTPTTPTLTAPSIKVGSVGKVKKGVAAVTVTCAGTPATAKPCAGKATLSFKAKGKKKATKVASASYNAAAGKSATVKLKVSASALKALKKVKGKASLAVTVSGGKAVTKSATVKG